MFKRMRGMYRAGRSGQPMPAAADNSVGEMAVNTAAFVGVLGASIFALGVLGRFVHPLTLSVQDRELDFLKKQKLIQELRGLV